MRQTAIALIAILSILPLVEGATPPDPHQFLLAMRRETKIEVRMVNGDRLDGRLGDVGNDRFSLTMGKTRDSQVRDVAFSDVHSVKRDGMRKSTKVLLIAGAVVVALGILVAVAAAEVRSIGQLDLEK